MKTDHERNYIYNEIYLCIRYYGTIDYESLKRNYVDNKESVMTYIKNDQPGTSFFGRVSKELESTKRPISQIKDGCNMLVKKERCYSPKFSS